MSELREHVDRPVRVLGFWTASEGDGLPNPADLVDASWDESERIWVSDYLRCGQVCASWMGASRCRLCSCPNGSRDLTDGYYLWPEGLAHYVLMHGVRLPTEFLAHIGQRLQALDELERDDSWWRENVDSTQVANASGVGRQARAAMEDPGERTRSAFLAVLGVQDRGGALGLLRSGLEVLAHPRTRSAVHGYGPVDTLVEFLAATELAASSEPLRAFQSWFRNAVRRTDWTRQRSPRSTTLQRIEELFGRPADDLAALLDGLLQAAAHCRTQLDSRALRRLYPEAAQLSEGWALALDEDIERPGGVPRSHQQDEIYAIGDTVGGAVTTSVPRTDRIAVSDLVRETAELLALDRQGVTNWAGWSERSPALGWPSVLAQLQYRLHQVAVSVEEGDSPLVSPTVESAADSGQPDPRSQSRRGRALHLLDAYDGALADVSVDSPGAGFQRIRRSGRQALPHADLLQVAELLYRLPPDHEQASALAVLQRCLAVLACPGDGPLPSWWSTREPDAAELPLNTWEMRERFPELAELLRLYRAVVAEARYGAAQDPDELVGLVSARYTETRHSSPLHISALVGEIAGVCSLLADDGQLDQALRHLGAEPRQPDAPWWDELTWRSWLRTASGLLIACAPRI